MQTGRHRTIKYCAYALVMLVFFILQHSRGTSISLFGASADSLPFIIAAIALFDGPYVAGSFGFAAGLMASLHSPVLEGLSALYMGLFGVAFGLLGALYMRRVLVGALIGGSLCLLVQGACRYFFYFRLVYDVNIAAGAINIAAELALSILPGIVVFYIIRALNRRFSEQET